MQNEVLLDNEETDDTECTAILPMPLMPFGSIGWLAMLTKLAPSLSIIMYYNATDGSPKVSSALVSEW